MTNMQFNIDSYQIVYAARNFKRKNNTQNVLLKVTIFDLNMETAGFKAKKKKGCVLRGCYLVRPVSPAWP